MTTVPPKTTNATQVPIPMETNAPGKDFGAAPAPLDEDAVPEAAAVPDLPAEVAAASMWFGLGLPPIEVGMPLKEAWSTLEGVLAGGALPPTVVAVTLAVAVCVIVTVAAVLAEAARAELWTIPWMSVSVAFHTAFEIPTRLLSRS